MIREAACPRCGEPMVLSENKPEGEFRFVERHRETPPVARDIVYGRCDACSLLVVDVAAMERTQQQSRDDILDAIDRARRARAIFDRGHGDSHAAMTELARAFHALRRIEPPGIEPWAPDALWGWLQQAAASRHELACAHFVLSVWDSRGPAGTFDAMAALAGWDRAHRAAFIEWAREPWWP